jgi:DNA-binding Lrp family transcriptional regulator
MQILGRLLNNCRESDRQIGMEVGISGGAVKSRIKKMQKNGVIEYFTLKIEPPVLGYGVLYFVVTGEDLDEILQQVKLVGEPFFVVPCVGGITVCSIVVKENVQQKIELAKNLMKDVRVLSIFEAENPGVSSDLTKTDLEIINELTKDPRQNIENIAKKTNLSSKTVTRSIEKLQNDDAIQFTLVYEPTKLKGYIPYCILTWIDGDLKQTLQELENKFSEYFMQIPFIAKNQVVLFMCSDNIFKLDDLTLQARNVPGVKTADLFIPRKIAFPQEWIKDAVKEAKKSPTLHLLYQTN